MSSGGFTAGRTLGRYEILIPIAEGGMACVWAARMKGQRGFQKIVAIKQMKPELSDEPSFETMFLDEAGLVSRLKHPNLAEILDLGEEEDTLFQVMEYVDGEPLNRLLRRARGGLPIPLAVRITKEACAGLHAAHELRDEEGRLVNLVHRDVSLQNILVTYDGVTKVIDFGVAKAISNLQQTSVGQVKGKIPYMSPEQAMGDAVDRRTDVFALGIVLYQLSTGKHPFRGETDLETMMHICAKTPVTPPAAIAKAVPPELDAVIVKALAKDKNARFATMLEMMRALEAALPPNEHASAEDLSQFMQTHLGAKGEQRRLAIQEAGRVLDQGGSLEPKCSFPPPPSSRSSGAPRSSRSLPSPPSRPGGAPVSVRPLPPPPISRPPGVPPSARPPAEKAADRRAPLRHALLPTPAGGTPSSRVPASARAGAGGGAGANRSLPTPAGGTPSSRVPASARAGAGSGAGANRSLPTPLSGTPSARAHASARPAAGGASGSKHWLPTPLSGTPATGPLNLREDSSAVTPPPATPTDRTAGGLQMQPKSRARSRRASCPLRTWILGLIAAVIGLGVGLAAFTVAAPDAQEESIKVLSPVVGAAAPRLRPSLPTPPPGTTGTGADAGTTDGGSNVRGRRPQRIPRNR